METQQTVQEPHPGRSGEEATAMAWAMGAPLVEVEAAIDAQGLPRVDRNIAGVVVEHLREGRDSYCPRETSKALMTARRHAVTQISAGVVAAIATGAIERGPFETSIGVRLRAHGYETFEVGGELRVARETITLDGEPCEAAS